MKIWQLIAGRGLAVFFAMPAGRVWDMLFSFPMHRISIIPNNTNIVVG
jgi:hypothetical protein